MIHLLFENYVTKIFELMVVVYLKWNRIQVDSYIYDAKKWSKKSPISLNSSIVSTITKPKSKDSIIKAEILQALRTIGRSFWFASANGNGKLFREMFLDSDITEGKKWDEKSETRNNYPILGRAFSFHFDKKWKRNMMVLYNIGRIPLKVLWYRIADQ